MNESSNLFHSAVLQWSILKINWTILSFHVVVSKTEKRNLPRCLTFTRINKLAFETVDQNSPTDLTRKWIINSRGKFKLAVVTIATFTRRIQK